MTVTCELPSYPIQRIGILLVLYTSPNVQYGYCIVDEVRWYFCSVNAVDLKGGTHTVLDMGSYEGTRMYGIAVLRAECHSLGSSGR